MEFDEVCSRTNFSSKYFTSSNCLMHLSQFHQNFINIHCVECKNIEDGESFERVFSIERANVKTNTDWFSQDIAQHK